MLHSFAAKTATAALDRKLIREDRYEWCVYCLEKLFMKLVFAFWLTLFAVITKRYVEIIAFLAGVLPMRAKLGGWHAKRAWVCQVISLFLIFLLCCVLPVYIYCIPKSVAAIGTLGALGVAFAVKPIYPPQLHFNHQVREANHHKKNGIVLIIAIVQVLFIVMNKILIASYLTMGVLVSLASLLIEYIIQNPKGGISDEGMGESVP